LEVIGGYTVNYNLPPTALAVSLVIALVVSQGAALYPAWRAATVRIIEAVQHE
jgi:ABC-type lipoprotein release transport system permease subunit